MTEQKSNARTLVGTVISDKMDQSAVVMVERFVKHQKYGKFVKRSSKLTVHNDGGYKIGAKVKIMATRAISKNKSWQIIEQL